MNNTIQIDKKTFFILTFFIIVIFVGSIFVSYKMGKEAGEINALPWNISPTPTIEPTQIEPTQIEPDFPNEPNTVIPEEQSVPPSTGTEVGCTMEAKICPDGSAVGRMPPNCEFAPCP